MEKVYRATSEKPARNFLAALSRRFNPIRYFCYMNNLQHVRRLLPAAILLALSALTASAQSSVNGYLKIGDTRYEMKHITAVRVVDTFRPELFATRLSLSDLPVTEEQLRDPLGIASLKTKGGFHGVTFEIGDQRSSVSMNLWSSDHAVIVSMSGTMDAVELTAQTPTLIIGQVKNLHDTVGGLQFELYAGFSSAIKDLPSVPKGETKQGAAAADLEPVKVYLAMRQAIRTGDMTAIKQLARYPQDFEGPEGAAFLKLMQEEEPKDIKVLEASEMGEVATLTVSGTKAGEPVRRTFQMQKKDGKWSTNNDNWQAN